MRHFLAIFKHSASSILTVFVPLQKHPFLVFNQWNPLFRPQIWSSLTRLNWRDDPLSTATFEPILIPESPMHFKPSERKSPQLWIALKMTLPSPTETKSFWPWPTFWAVSLSKKFVKSHHTKNMAKPSQFDELFSNCNIQKLNM